MKAMDKLTGFLVEALNLPEGERKKDNYLSLEGIYMPKKIIEESTLPAALTQYLKDFPKINGIALHLDNDTAGRLAAKTIQTILPMTYTVSDEPPKRGKDILSEL